MIKALSRILKQDRERMNIPRSVQQVIPVKRIWLDGIWLVGNKYSKCWRFTDINYAIASKDDKTSMFLDYSELLNALDSNATTKITVCNKRMNKHAFEESILLPLQGDQYDGYRKEYNDMLLDNVTDVSNSIVQERYVTVSVAVKNIDEARIIRDIQLSEENLKKCRYERLSEIFPRIMFYSYATVKTTKETGGFNMNQQTNENNSTSCSYQELNPEMDAFLQGYLEEGRRKGLQESTIHLHDKIGHYFLFAMTKTGCLKPQEMNAQNVGIACLKISSRWYLSHIRTFLRYAYQSGNTDRDYSGIVPLFKIPQPYPSVYTAEEIQKIENSVDQSSPHGKRDYAALLLATRLGIRSGDISSMTLECLDFERNLIRLTQHKTGVFIEFPMVSDVKVALERYLQEERTAYDSPYVFLRIVPPYGHISVQAIAKIARTAIAVAGIEPGGRKQGAHAFRSSLASSMINDNIPYEAVRKILGHTDQNAIRSYARLDMEQLRGYALPVMEATDIFAEFLEGRWSLS